MFWSVLSSCQELTMTNPSLATGAESAPLGPADRSVPLYEVLDGRSYIIPDSGHMVDYYELDDATIKLFISKDLPGAVKQALPELVGELASSNKVDLKDCCFAIHPGGPKVIKNCAAALGVASEVMGTSWHVMKRHGNLSGSSNLVVLDHLRRLAATNAEGVEEKEYCVCVSMGPGVCVEAVLLRRFGWKEMQGEVCKHASSALVIPEIDDSMLSLVLS
jgi:predicted naringenin-chalcone synthase